MGLGNTSWHTKGVMELGLLVRKLELECLERKKELEWKKREEGYTPLIQTKGS